AVTIHKAAQVAVTIGAPATLTFGDTTGVATAADGSGTGAYSFSSTGSTACTVNSTSGAITVTSGTGTCSLTASRASDANYDASAASAPAAVTKLGRAPGRERIGVPATVTFGDRTGLATATISVPATLAFGDTTSLATAADGSGTGAYSFSSTGSTACTVHSTTGAITVTSGTGTCSLTASRASDANYDASAASAPAAVT